MAKDLFLIIDGSSLLFRAFYALPILTNGRGEYTNAVYGFATMLNKVLREQKPTKVAVCFDRSRVTFRTELFSEYKGTRKDTPEELIPQFDLVKKYLDAMDIRHEDLDNYEADDIIGTLSKVGEAEGMDVLVLTGDRDELQLIAPHTKVMLTKKGISETVLWDLDLMNETFGLTPTQFIDLKGLMGDTSDNIPGVKGIGEKTALKLMAEYGSIENIYANIENVTPKGVQNKLIAGESDAKLSKTLATINREVPMDTSLEKYTLPPQDVEKLRTFYEQMNFTRLLQFLPAKENSGENVETLKKDEISTEELTNENINELKGHLYVYLHSIKEKLVGIGVAGRELKKAYYLPASNVSLLAPILNNKKDYSIWDYKQAKVLFSHNDSTLLEPENDLFLMAYLLDPTGKDYSISVLRSQYGLSSLDLASDELVNAGLFAWGMKDLEKEILKDLENKELLKVYQQIELPLSTILGNMEIEGIKVNKKELENLTLAFSKREAELTCEIYDLAGHSFNVSSPKQLSVVLFEELGLTPIKKTKTGYSTNSEVLQELLDEHEIIEKVLEYRNVNKLRTTYGEGLQALITENGRIHSTFTQTVTATGRLSSVNPNLQNIPVRTENGRKIRKAFVADENSKLVSADYSQIELRVLAAIADDERLINAFKNGYDIHQSTASEVFGVPMEEVTKEQRRRAKAVNFGIVYGISDFGLSQDLGISRAEAKQYISMYLERYPNVDKYMKDVVAVGREKGYVETLYGRKRWLPDLHNKNFNMRSFAERAALNTPIQGSAADILKIAMLNLDKRLKAENLKTKMLLTVHDELIFNVPNDELEKAVAVIREEMEGAVELSVPLKVDVELGENWYDME